MDTAVKNGSVDIDLKNKRMAHLPPVIKAKMTHVHLVDKQVPVYEFEEKLKFDLSVEAKTKYFQSIREGRNKISRWRICCGGNFAGIYILFCRKKQNIGNGIAAAWTCTGKIFRIAGDL